MAINFPNSPSVNDIHVEGANRWQWNGTSWTRIGGAITDAINSTNDNSTTTLYPVMVTGTGSQNAKIATTANKNLKFNAAEGDLTVGGDISGINANLTGILTASQYNSITAPGANITGVATALQLKGPLTSSGINVTGVSTFSGNVSVGGVLTYEDVKNVDSVGLITARSGAVVKTGTATTALIVEGDARITGILTVGTGSLVITDKDINATGIITGANFKSGTTNVHNVGVEAAGINVLGADTPIGTGATVYNSGLIVSKKGAEFQGVVTASSFKGSGADLTDVISGIGIGTESGIVGYAATIVHFKGPGVSTAYYSSATGVGTVYFTGGGSASVSISESAPSSPSAGDMWWDSDVGNLQIYYTDANSSQWVTANNSGPQGPQGRQGAQGAQGHQGHQGVQGAQGHQGVQGAQGHQGRQGAQGVQGSVGIASLTISTGAPSSPAQGDMWWDSDDANLSIYYNDGNSSQWVNINHGPSGPQGAQGAQGVQGAAGAQGAQGRQGATGAAGAQGAQGHQGVQGTAGTNATVSNNANNRVITGGSGTNLNGEANFMWDGSNLAIGHNAPDSNWKTKILVAANASYQGGLNVTNGTNSDFNVSIKNSLTAIGNGTNNPLAFFTNGSSNERFRITSNGLKVGTTVDNNYAAIHAHGGSATRLHLTSSNTGTTTSDGAIIMIDSSSNMEILNKENTNLEFFTNNSERLRIDNNGKILVATTTTSEAHANQDELIIGSTSDNNNHGLTIVTPSSKYGTVAFSDGSSGTSQGLLEYNHSGDYMRIYTAASERFRITSAGRVQIGLSGLTGGDDQALVVANPVGDGKILELATTASNGRLHFSRVLSNTLNTTAIIENTEPGAQGTGDLRFYTSPSSNNPTERLRIDSDGFIKHKFTSNNSTVAEGLFINNMNNGTGNNASLIFSNDSGERKKASISYIDTGSYGTGDLVFSLDNDADSGELHVTNHERVRITKDGHVLFSAVTTNNDTRNPKGITVKSSSGISFLNYGSNGSRNWRIRPDDLSAWGSLEFSVSPTDNSSTDWPDASTDVVLELKKNKDVKIHDGNLIIGTAGHGIDFAATANSSGSMSNELLDDYEEGSWTPTPDNLTNTPQYYNRVGNYTKIGNMVYAIGFLQFGGSPAPQFSSTGSHLTVSGLPYPCDAGTGYVGCVGAVTYQSMNWSGSPYNDYSATSKIIAGANSSSKTTFRVDGTNNTIRGTLKREAWHNSSCIVTWELVYRTNS